jgi:protein-histidine pros-kinase
MPVAATALLDQLLIWSEQEKAQLARELHDDMGGMLVAAVMDLAWIEQRLGAGLDADSHAKFVRVQQCLRAAIDLKRTLIEQLRPSLLDNFGLFAALRWLFGKTCSDAGVSLSQDYPAEEPQFDPEAAITIYRVLQAALAIVLARASLDRAELTVAVDRGEITFRLGGKSKEVGGALRVVGGAEREIFELAAMRHRMRALGGDTAVTRTQGCEDIAMIVRIPIGAAVTASVAPVAPVAPVVATEGCEL